MLKESVEERLHLSARAVSRYPIVLVAVKEQGLAPVVAQDARPTLILEIHPRTVFQLAGEQREYLRRLDAVAEMDDDGWLVCVPRRQNEEEQLSAGACSAAFQLCVSEA